MTKFYNPVYNPGPVTNAHDARSLTTTFITVVNLGIASQGLSAVKEQQKLKASLDRQLRRVYKHAMEEKKLREAAQMPTHAKHENRPVNLYSKGSRSR